MFSDAKKYFLDMVTTLFFLAARFFFLAARFNFLFAKYVSARLFFSGQESFYLQ